MSKKRKKKNKFLATPKEPVSLQPTYSVMDNIKPGAINNLWNWNTLEDIKF